MPKRHYISPDQNSGLVCNGLLPPPEGWTEVSAGDYDQWQTARRERAAELAAAWWAEHQPALAADKTDPASAK